MRTTSPLLGRPFTLGASSRRFFSYDDIEDLVLAHRREVVAEGYAHVVALLRGGSYAAAMLAQSAGLTLQTARYDRTTGRVDCDLPGVQGCIRPKVLLVEDVAGKGATLVSVKAHLEGLGYEVHVFVVCWDGLSRLVPEYGVRLLPGERYVFPWERSLLQETAAVRSSNDSDTAGWLTGFDLDGVFLPDLPSERYEQDLEAALKERDNLQSWPNPRFWEQEGLVVSARLEQDRSRTLAWLGRHGIRVSKLLLRADEQEPSGEYKKRMCVEHGICEFVESDAGQAAVIAQLPHVIVWHYDPVQPRRVRP